MKIYFAADHAGFEMKNALIEFTKNNGYEIEDCGAFEYDKEDDYPDFIACAVRKLSEDSKNGLNNRAIILGGSGIGEAIVANRFNYVRCAVYYGEPKLKQIDASGNEISIIESSRMHNDSNCLSIGARFVSLEDAQRSVDEWLSTNFSKDARHKRRIEKIDFE